MPARGLVRVHRARAIEENGEYCWTAIVLETSKANGGTRCELRATCIKRLKTHMDHKEYARCGKSAECDARRSPKERMLEFYRRKSNKVCACATCEDWWA